MLVSVFREKQETDGGGKLFCAGTFFERNAIRVEGVEKARVDTWLPRFLGYYFTATHSVKHSAVLGRLEIFSKLKTS